MKLTQARIDEVKALRGALFYHKLSTLMRDAVAQEDAKCAFTPSDKDSDSVRHKWAVRLARKHKIPLRADAAKGVR